MEALQIAFPISIAILLGVALILCACGFKKFVYFMSVGYGLAVAGIAITIVILNACKFENMVLMSWIDYILCALLVVYGLRLSLYLIYREAKSAAYKKNILDDKNGSGKKIPVFVSACIWLVVGIMYVQQTAPITYRILNHKDAAVAQDMIAPIIGACIMAVAIFIEALADHQKNAAKKKNPKSFVSTGLYRFVRCPNYLGEMMFWTGVLVAGSTALTGWAQWVMTIIGYVLIIYVMLSGAKRLENRQDKNYGDNPEYQAYKAKTPILMHLIPVKSIKNWKFIK